MKQHIKYFFQALVIFLLLMGFVIGGTWLTQIIVEVVKKVLERG